jgi:hypothetical protein
LLLRKLVNSCSPDRLPTDGQHYGVKPPDKDVLETARKYLDRESPRDVLPKPSNYGKGRTVY